MLASGMTSEQRRLSAVFLAFYSYRLLNLLD